MTLEQYAYLAEIIGVILVIASLMYVARQLKQTAAATVASSRHAIISQDENLLAAVMAYPEIFAARYKDKNDLTHDEKIRLENWLIELVRSREHQWMQYVEGMLDEKSWRSYLSGLSLGLSYPRTRAWWNFVKRDFFDIQFTKVVDQHLSTIPLMSFRGSTFDMLPDDPDSVDPEYFEALSRQ